MIFPGFVFLSGMARGGEVQSEREMNSEGALAYLDCTEVLGRTYLLRPGLREMSSKSSVSSLLVQIFMVNPLQGRHC